MKISRVFNLFLLIFPLLAFISYTYSSVALTITFLTFTYHIWMRAICGAIFSILTYSHWQAHGNLAMVTTAASRRMSYTVSGPRDPSGLALWSRRPSPVPFGSWYALPQRVCSPRHSRPCRDTPRIPGRSTHGHGGLWCSATHAHRRSRFGTTGSTVQSW